MQFTASIHRGKTIWSDPDAVIAHVAKLEGKRVNVTIEQWRARRSDEQNRYLHGVVFKALSDHLGYEVEEVKELCKAMFLMQEKDGRQFPRPTSSLNTAEMVAFIERIQRWAAQEFGVVIPDPA
jgi:hypothetical protein